MGFGCLLVWLAAACFGQGHEALCPRHVEPPVYPQIARVAHVTGNVVLSVTIDADGHVTNAEATNQDKFVALLKPGSIENIRHWTFAKPPFAPYVETIIYEYKIDLSLPLDDRAGVIQKASFDLPDRVTIVTNGGSVETERSRE
ncbi:MAG: energy transducer TonB [Candidatus Acidiferrales bacterium]